VKGAGVGDVATDKRTRGWHEIAIVRTLWTNQVKKGRVFTSGDGEVATCGDDEVVEECLRASDDVVVASLARGSWYGPIVSRGWIMKLESGCQE